MSRRPTVRDLLRSLRVRIDLIWPRLYEPLAIRKVYWVPEIVDIDALTRNELDNGIDLTSLVLAYDFAGEEPSIEFRHNPAVLSLLTRNLSGHIVMLPERDVPYRGERRVLDAYPVRVIGTTQKADTDNVSFVVTAPPTRNVAVPDVPNARPTRRELRRIRRDFARG